MTSNIEPRIPAALYISPGDPWNAPRGGQTAFAKAALNALGDRFAVVAPDERGDVPEGRWAVGDWNGTPIWRFNIGSYAPKNKSRAPLVPRRIVFRGRIRRFMPEIRALGIRDLFCDSPEILDVLNDYNWNSVCYCFAGLNNPVGSSRYRVLRGLGGWFHRRMMVNLRKLRPEVLLAAADRDAIRRFEAENCEFLNGTPIDSFPTRFDADVFFPADATEIEKTRRELNCETFFPRLVVVGRLCWIKGWDLALETLKLLKTTYSKPLLTFVGDGEERVKLERRVRELNLGENVRVEGFLPPPETRRRLVAADLYLVASWREGWSVAATEALACGKTIVSTNVSGAKEMVFPGKNGIIVATRRPEELADAIRNATRTPSDPNEFSLELAKRFSSTTLADDWKRFWKSLNKK